MSDDVGLWRTRLIRLSGSTCVRRSDRALSKIRVFVKCKRHDTNKLDTRSGAAAPDDVSGRALFCGIWISHVGGLH